MAHTIQIGNTYDDPRKVDKTFENARNTTVNLKNPCSLESPVFVLDYSTTVMGCNYIYFPDWGRYYYIDDIQVAPGKKLELYCSVDVLKSFSDEIKACTGCVTRSESIGKPTYVTDDKLPIDPERKELKSILFDGGLNFDIGSSTKNMIVQLH